MKKSRKKSINRSTKHFTVLYKRQSKCEQLHPDMRGVDNSLHTMIVDAKTEDSARKILSKMELMKVVRVTEIGITRPIFKIATKKDFASQTYTL